MNWLLAWLAADVVGLVALLAHGYLAERRAARRPAVPTTAPQFDRPSVMTAVDARLLAELEATHRRTPLDMQSQIDQCATQLRREFDYRGVDLGDPVVVGALGAFVDAVDLLAEASSHGAGGGSPAAAWLWASSASLAVSAGRQVVLSSARGEIHRQVDP